MCRCATRPARLPPVSTCAAMAATCWRRRRSIPAARAYAWSVDSASAIAEAPDWLLARIADHTNGNGEATPPEAWRELVAGGVDEGAARLHRCEAERPFVAAFRRSVCRARADAVLECCALSAAAPRRRHHADRRQYLRQRTAPARSCGIRQTTSTCWPTCRATTACRSTTSTPTCRCIVTFTRRRARCGRPAASTRASRPFPGPTTKACRRAHGSTGTRPWSKCPGARGCPCWSATGSSRKAAGSSAAG